MQPCRKRTTIDPIMIQIQINDKRIETQEGKTVLQAARENGIHIPTLCYHPALKPSGSCRLCAVESISATGRSAILWACLLKVKEGMKVRTDTHAVQQARASAFERLVAMAPTSQHLRQMAAREGIDLPTAPDGCIRCRLCIRVCKEIVGQEALRMEKQDGRSLVVPVPGRCIGCGTCANLCPTHAIRIIDQDGVRTIRIRDVDIGHHPLERCEGCGKFYATEKHVALMASRTASHPQVKLHHHYCPNCAKLFSDRLEVIKKQPPKQKLENK